MPISPTVNAYLQADEAPTGAEAKFKENFGQAAFTSLKSKFPKLVSLVITFKVLDFSIEDSNAFGVFVLKAGEDVRYIPTVMSDSSIVSCEMLYDKASNSFTPLSIQEVNTILTTNMLGKDKILTKRPYVEDTRRLFNDLVCPPITSNVVLAGNRNKLASLPNNYKQKLAEYIGQHPNLLVKISGFYPPEWLGQRLQPTPEAYKLPETKTTVIKMGELQSTSIPFLSEADKAVLLDKGFILKNATETDQVLVLDNIKDYIENTLLAYEYTSTESAPTKLEQAMALHLNETGICKVPVIFNNTRIYYKDSKCAKRNSGTTQMVLVSGLKTATRAALMECGVITPAEYATKKDEYKDYRCIDFLYPLRLGGYGVFTEYLPNLEYRNIDGCETLVDPKTNLTNIIFSKKISYGYIVNDGVYTVPQNTLLHIHSMSPSDTPGKNAITSIANLVKYLTMFGTNLNLLEENKTFSLTDKNLNKTAVFKSRPDLAEHLFKTYGLGYTDIDKVMSSRNSLVLHKTAFMTENEEVPTQMEQSSMQEPEFEGEDLSAFADFEDPELMDTGMLIGFANNPDIKSMLLDYLPDFTTTLTNIGRVILLLTSQAEEMTAYYGKEKHTELLGNCRKVFRLVGDLVHDLKEYTSMV